MKEDHHTEMISWGELAIQRFRLRGLSGPDRGVEHTSTDDEISIGTSPANSLVLSDKKVSRHHCVITITGSGALVRDLGSTNGTFVDRVRVQAAYLQSGSILTIGDTSLRVELLDESIHEPISQAEILGNILGTSAAMRRIFVMIERVAGSMSTVLLEGETGTGKTLIAEAIHQNSERAGPFVVVDCSAIPAALMESELFGHERGAFTNAHVSRAGAFANARGGTVLLDEVGELPLALQPKLLRALDERVIKPIGAAEPIKLDIRVIAATNRDLREEINRGNFRSDLYYRLNTVRLRVPPLRERPEDIPLLVAHFFSQFAPGSADAPPLDLMQSCLKQTWPGNVRELRSVVERAVLLGDTALDSGERPGMEVAASPSDFWDMENFAAEASYREAKQRVVERFERWFVSELITRHNGNLSRAARDARMDRNHLRELLRRHNVSIP